MRNTRIWRLCGLAALLLNLATTVQAQTYSVIYNFGDIFRDAVAPQYSGIIAQGRDGSLFSTTPFGGQNGAGTVFKVSTSGQVSVVYSFNITDGQYPYGGLTLGADGCFYGTTYSGGGSFNGGVIFKITADGKLTVLHTFVLGEGFQAMAPPVLGEDGNLYGTTRAGGANGYGSIYRISPTGQFKTVYSFDYTHGRAPMSPLMVGADENFYGTAWEGGKAGIGTVFRMTLKGNVTTVHNFSWTDGAYPYGPLVQAADGNLYGTAAQGGSAGFGTVFKVSAKGVYKTLHSFAAGEQQYSYVGVVQGTDGNFYGGTYGNFGLLYQITPTGTFSLVHTFDNFHGSHPNVTPMQHTTGTLYGDTVNGGTHGSGTFYSVDASLKPYAALVPAWGKVGNSVGLLGQGLTGTKSVSLNGAAAMFTVISDTFLTATVPDGATTGPITLTTPTGKLVSNQNFRVLPVINSFTPTSGPVATKVTITGVSLMQTKAVKFGSAIASFTVVNDKQVTAIVPTNAKSAKITITTAGGSALSTGSFTVTP